MLGLETLAIIYSLPYALLMWGCVYSLSLSGPLADRTLRRHIRMVTFLIAFSLECFSTTSKAATFATAAATSLEEQCLERTLT